MTVIFSRKIVKRCFCLQCKDTVHKFRTVQCTCVLCKTYEHCTLMYNLYMCTCVVNTNLSCNWWFYRILFNLVTPFTKSIQQVVIQIHLLISSFIHLFTYSLIHLFIYSLIHLFTYSLIHLFTYSSIHLFTYSFIHF